ncbi:MAG: CPBP family intramembrane metalloprotease [Phycisphaerales bacterium]|nr:CPBP family intramembrane metalloprotease [Phycisphaerales bacterium]
MPELNFKFHWLAVPVGVVVFVGWVWLGMIFTYLFHEPSASSAPVQPDPGLPSITFLVTWMIDPAQSLLPAAWAGEKEPTFFDTLPAAYAWLTMALRLLGMAIVVPLFEELFMRSLLLRSFLHARPTAIGMVQVLYDLPLVGDLIERTGLGQKAHQHGPIFGQQFMKNPLGQLTFFGVMVSSVLFMLGHLPRDWAGCILCGVLYCLLLRATRDKGLGPVIWAHGITNALLWAYTLHTDDWQFL